MYKEVFLLFVFYALFYLFLYQSKILLAQTAQLAYSNTVGYVVD